MSQLVSKTISKLGFKDLDKLHLIKLLYGGLVLGPSLKKIFFLQKWLKVTRFVILNQCFPTFFVRDTAPSLCYLSILLHPYHLPETPWLGTTVLKPCLTLYKLKTKLYFFFRRKIWKLINEEKHGRTIILTTHNLDEAEILSDSIAIIHQVSTL
jgi:hypothetical protein